MLRTVDDVDSRVGRDTQRRDEVRVGGAFVAGCFGQVEAGLRGLPLRLGRHHHGGHAAFSPRHCGILQGFGSRHRPARGAQPAACGAKRKIGATYREGQLLMNPGERDIRDEGIGPSRPVLTLAASEVEQQPFQREHREDFARVRDEVACRNDRVRDRQWRTLVSADHIDRYLRRIFAFIQPHRQRGPARLFPRHARFGIVALRYIDQLGKAVAAIRFDRDATPLSEGLIALHGGRHTLECFG